MEKKENHLIYLLAILYALITGLSFLFNKIALQITDPIDILAHRFTAAFIGALIPILFGWIKLSVTKEKIKKILPLALFYPLLFFGFQTTGLQYATSAEGGILLASSPIFTLILASYFLKEESTLLQKISILISVAGVIFITIMKSATLDFHNILGIILLLFSSLSLAGYNVLGRVLTQDFSSLELSIVMITISFLCYNTIAIGKYIIHGNVSQYFAPWSNVNFILSIIYLGVLSSFATSLMTNFILSKIEASRMSVFANLGTVISILAGMIFLRENIYSYHILGSIFIVGGVIGTNYFNKLNRK
ncbi:DMT family transporter [Irregularibacter muris]|uniref:DMT family transporter n=1 Tax=Irregularibacter muris TaxID=1796619 RepID=A0AAE3L034_9FIRM|nr:DMT family transporter [Irregularibacter muris]MCR1899641.1 DMT family transporter [Irregularibacter muris]